MAENICGISPASVPVTVSSTVFTPTITSNTCFLAAPNGSNYQWFLNGNVIAGATGQFHTATQTGFYSVAMTNAQGCAGTSEPLFFNCTSGTAEPEPLAFFALPNPTDGQFWLRTEGAQPDALWVTDMLGRQVLAVSRPAAGQVFSLENVAPGTYCVLARMEGRVFRQLLVLTGR